MAQEDEVAGRMYAELDLLEGTTDAPRGSVLHQELVSDYVRRAMRDKDSIMHDAIEADKDIFQIFRTSSEEQLASVGLRRVSSVKQTSAEEGT